MKRRQFMTLVADAAVASPFTARAQQAMPLVAVVNSGTEAANARNIDALRQGLKETEAAVALGVEVVPSRIATAADIESVTAALANGPGGSLLMPPDSTDEQNRDLIIALAERHRLPAVYAFRFFVAAGGLMSYGIDQVAMFRKAASYVDRILRGEKPADLPVQAPTKYETVVNLRAAKAIGLTPPDSLLVRADEVIE
jgi:putative ABC transport system substrate-binding protein